MPQGILKYSKKKNLTVAKDATNTISNRPTFYDAKLSKLQYVDSRFGLKGTDDEWNRLMIEAAYDPTAEKYFEYKQKEVGRELLKGSTMRNRSIRNYSKNSNAANNKLGLGGVLDVAEKAAPYVLSAANTIFNKKQTDKLAVNRSPILANPTQSQYKSALPNVTDTNEASFQSFISNDDPNLGATGKQNAFGTLLDANTKASIADAGQLNQFNQNNDRLSAQISQYNVNAANVTSERNIMRQNDKLIAGTQAINAGTQDLINVDANRQGRNMQNKAMMLKFLENADNGTIERAAGELGYTAEEFIDILNDPNKELGRGTSATGYADVPRAISRKGISSTINNYAPETLPIN